MKPAFVLLHPPTTSFSNRDLHSRTDRKPLELARINCSAYIYVLEVLQIDVKKTVIKITTDIVKLLICSQFPQWKDYEIRPVSFQGWDNRTFHLGDTMLVRLPSNERYTSQTEKEQKWLPVLRDKLPFQIPELIAKGKPDKTFQYHWGIYKWIEGEIAGIELINDLNKFAKDLAYFLTQLYKVEASNAPLAGQHCFYRGAPLLTYDTETKRAIKNLANFIDSESATEIWNNAAKTVWDKSPVWFHGDFAASNLLVNNGKLSAVIDFGCCGAGDPSCDLAIAWTFLRGEAREIFKSELGLDEAAWHRGRAWALWKALITIEESLGKSDTDKIINAKNILTEIIKD